MLKVMQKGNRNFSAYKVEVSRQESIGLQQVKSESPKCTKIGQFKAALSVGK